MPHGWTAVRRTLGMGLLAVAVLAAALVLRALTGPSPAGAAKVTLSKAERRALDVWHVRTFYDTPGLRVSIRFRGDIAARLGRGHLANAVAAVVLMPKDGPVRSAAMIAGPGKDLRLAGRGDARAVGVTLTKNVLRFLLPDVDPSELRGIVVKTLVRAPGLGKARAASTGQALSRAVACAGKPKARAAEYGYEGESDVGTAGQCGGDDLSLRLDVGAITPAEDCEGLDRQIEAITNIRESLRVQIARDRAAGRNRLARIHYDLRYRFFRKLEELKRKKADLCAAATLAVDGKADYDHTYDPDNQGYSSVCSEWTTAEGAEFTVTYEDLSGKDATATRTGTTVAGGLIRTVSRITSGDKTVRVRVVVRKGGQEASKQVDVAVPAPNNARGALDCRALNGG